MQGLPLIKDGYSASYVAGIIDEKHTLAIVALKELVEAGFTFTTVNEHTFSVLGCCESLGHPEELRSMKQSRPLSNLSTTAQEVFDVLRQRALNNSAQDANKGMHKIALAGRLSTPTHRIAVAIVELVEHGYVFATGESDEYAVLDF